VSEAGDGEAPPFLTWGRLYALVIVTLAVVIALLAWLTERWA
jgi:hypothetical protein